MVSGHHHRVCLLRSWLNCCVINKNSCRFTRAMKSIEDAIANGFQNLCQNLQYVLFIYHHKHSAFQCRPIISALIERRIERNEDRLGRLAGKSCCKSCCCNNVSFTHWQKDDAVSNSKSLQSVTTALLLGRWPKMALHSPPSTAHQRVLGEDYW